MFRAECVRMQSAANLFADLIAEAQPFDTESPAKTARPLYRAECCNAARYRLPHGYSHFGAGTNRPCRGGRAGPRGHQETVA